jgi:hypothetical protein
MANALPRSADATVLRRLRQLLLLVLAVGLLGTGTDLLALEHFEDPWQSVPVGLIAVALAVVIWNGAAPSRGSVRALQALMALFVAAGALGMYLHFQGNLEFQLEMDPSQERWDLFWKVIRAKAPPSLAPGSMAQLGFLGLLWAFRHPAVSRASASSAGITGGA